MVITKKNEENAIIFMLEGRLDSLSSTDLQDAIITAFDECPLVTLDFDRLDYVSSAGLRVLLMAQKIANGRRCEMRIQNVSEEVMQVFIMTGFAEFLTMQVKNNN